MLILARVTGHFFSLFHTLHTICVFVSVSLIICLPHISRRFCCFFVLIYWCSNRFSWKEKLIYIYISFHNYKCNLPAANEEFSEENSSYILCQAYDIYERRFGVFFYLTKPKHMNFNMMVNERYYLTIYYFLTYHEWYVSFAKKLPKIIRDRLNAIIAEKDDDMCASSS